MKGQNTSSAVMQQRHTTLDAMQFFPTPRWGTRALCKYILSDIADMKDCSAWEPACGQGHMAESLKEYFGNVYASDIYPYGYGDVFDFTAPGLLVEPPPLPGDDPYPDWIITNPPFSLAETFARRALDIATAGVAMLVRVAWWESEDREAFFDERPPTYFCPFTGRLPMFKGRLSKSTETATAYAWFVWHHEAARETIVRRIPFRAKLDLDRADDWRPEIYGQASPYDGVEAEAQ